MIERHAGRRQGFRGMRHNARHHRVFGFKGFGNGAALDLREFLAGKVRDDGFFALPDRRANVALDGPTADHSFKAARVAARAQRPLRVNAHVPQLGSRALVSGHKIALDDHPAPHTRARKDPNDILGLASGAQPFLTHDAKIDVVTDHHADLVFLLQDLFEVHAAQTDVGRHHHPPRVIHDPRHRDTQPYHGLERHAAGL